MQTTGHKTEVMFTGYRIVAPADLKQAARPVEAYLEQSKETTRSLLDIDSEETHRKPNASVAN